MLFLTRNDVIQVGVRLRYCSNIFSPEIPVPGGEVTQ